MKAVASTTSLLTPGSVTVMVTEAVKLPLAVVTVILAVPAPMAVTKPDDETVATVVSLDVHVTDRMEI